MTVQDENDVQVDAIIKNICALPYREDGSRALLQVHSAISLLLDERNQSHAELIEVGDWVLLIATRLAQKAVAVQREGEGFAVTFISNGEAALSRSFVTRELADAAAGELRRNLASRIAEQVRGVAHRLANDAVPA